MQSKILLDIFTKLDHSRLHPGVFLLLVVTVLESKGDDSKEDANKDDNKDTTNVVDRYTSGILLIFFAGLLAIKECYNYHLVDFKTDVHSL